MAELGLTPASRSRLAIQLPSGPKPWEFGGPRRVIFEPSPRAEGDRAVTGLLPGDIVIPADADRL